MSQLFLEAINNQYAQQYQYHNFQYN